MANSSLNIASVDFDTLKANFITFLQSQSVFKDYDFTGSNINVLLDVMSYNSFLNSFYLNMAASEGFLDSAQLISSVISHAKELNYTPRSARSAMATVNISFATSSNTGVFEIPKGTQFGGTNANGGFTFVTAEAHTLTSASSTFTISALPIYEGSYINETFVVDNTIENQKFVISNPNVDTTSIAVTLLENNGQTVTDLSQATNLYGLTSTSKVYFIQATLNGSYEIVFGDGTFGYVPQNNATILVTYRITNGDVANGITSFTLDRDLGTFNSVTSTATVTTASSSTDGAAAEDIETIRFRAPRHYQTQDRAITATDYANIIYENYPEVKAVNVYGGETVSGSVEYGKVFISPVSQSGGSLTNAVKADIINFLSNKNSIAIQPVIVDPNYLYIIPTITATVDFNQTNMSPADVRSLLLSTSSSYNSQYLENFNTAFRFSKFVAALQDADPSILSIQLSNLLEKTITPTLNVSQPISVSFNNVIVPGTILSSQFLLSDGNTYVLTDYNPNVNSFQRTGSQTNYNVVNTNQVIYLQQITSTNVQNFTVVGTVNYTTGNIAVKSLIVSDFLGGAGIVFYGLPQYEDLYAIKNDLIEIDFNNISISAVSA